MLKELGDEFERPEVMSWDLYAGEVGAVSLFHLLTPNPLHLSIQLNPHTLGSFNIPLCILYLLTAEQ
jgi:hypothetical protein